MIRVVASVGGKITTPHLDELNLFRSTTWIDVDKPTLHELNLLRDTLGLPLTELRHALDTKERPRVKITSEYTLIIFGAHVTDTEHHSLPLALFLTKRYLLTIHGHTMGVLEGIDIHSDIFKKIMQRGLPFLLYTILFRTIKEYFDPVDMIEDTVEEVENDVIHHHTKKSTQRISTIKTKLVYMRKALIGNQKVIISFTKEHMGKDTHIFDDLNVEISQLIEEVDVYIERLNTSLNIYLTALSNRINEIMKSFTVIASLMLFPMFITGLYGMNVFLPLQHHPLAFFIISFLIVLMVVVILSIYKLKKWI